METEKETEKEKEKENETENEKGEKGKEEEQKKDQEDAENMEVDQQQGPMKSREEDGAQKEKRAQGSSQQVRVVTKKKSKDKRLEGEKQKGAARAVGTKKGKVSFLVLSTLLRLHKHIPAGCGAHQRTSADQDHWEEEARGGGRRPLPQCQGPQ